MDLNCNYGFPDRGIVEMKRYSRHSSILGNKAIIRSRRRISGLSGIMTINKSDNTEK